MYASITGQSNASESANTAFAVALANAFEHNPGMEWQEHTSCMLLPLQRIRTMSYEENTNNVVRRRMPPAYSQIDYVKVFSAIVQLSNLVG